jgi:hypothetical protein
MPDRLYIFGPPSSLAVINSSNNNNNFYSIMPAKKNGKQSYTVESLDIDWHTARSRPWA